jgi:membrane protease subunit HflC
MKTLALITIILGTVCALLFATGTLYTIPMTEQVIVTQFGKPVGDPITDAGLHFKIPFIQEVNRIEKRILEWDGNRTDMPTKDKTYISVDTFGRWQIVDPLEYFLRLRDERSAQSRLEDILGSETRNSIAKHDLIELIRSTKDRTPTLDDTLEEIVTSGEGSGSSRIGVLHPIRKGQNKIEEEIQEAARSKLAEFGIKLLDVRFKRVNYNPSVEPKIFERMTSERQQIASQFRSEGEGSAARIIGSKERDLLKIESGAYKTVQEIQGKADAEATLIYANAYNKSPEAAELYEFLKTMEMYKATIDKNTTILLSTDSEVFKFLKSADGKKTPAAPTPARPQPSSFEVQ